MRESGGRGQGPGRGAGGAGSQGGPGAARRTPGGPGRTGRQGGTSRADGGRTDGGRSDGGRSDGGRSDGGRSDGAGRPASPENPPRRPRDPLDLPFGRDTFGRDDGRDRPGRDSGDDARGRSRQEPSDDGRGRSRGQEPSDDARGRSRSRDDRAGGRSRAESGDGTRRRPRDDGERPRGPRGDGERPRGRGDADSPRGRVSRDGEDAERLRGRVQGRDDRGRGRPGDRADDRHAAPRGAGTGRSGAEAGRGVAGAGRGGAEEARRRSRQEDGPQRRTPTGSPRPEARERAARRGGDVPPPRGPRRPPPRPPRPPLVLRLGSPRRRINFGLIGMTFILSIFAGRLIQMQGLDSKVYEAAAADQRQHTETIPAKRGSITDVSGHDLAVTVEAREVSIDPTKVPADVRAKIAKVLAQQLGKDEQEIAAKLARTGTHYQLLARDVDPVVATRLLQARVPALSSKKTYKRLYPAGDLAGSLIGFVGDEGNGLGGMEQAKNSLLAGRDGEQRVETGRDGQRIPMTSSQRTAPVDGQDVRLTIDRDIQWAAQKSIGEQVQKSGADSGTVIVMDVRTAQIVAMANAPELDLNNWRKAPESRYVNKAAADVFEPGSTNKVITAAAALEAKAVTPDTVYQVPDRIRCADQVLRDAHAHKVEALTFRQAMAQSSNVATVMAARKVGSQKLYEMLKAFGFGTTPGGGVPSAEAGLLPDYRKWSGSQSCTVAYGQGVSVTALQMASVYQTIANGGVKIEPQIVAGTTDATGRFVPAPAGKQTRVVSETTAEEITTMLESAVGEEGTGQLAAIDGYRVAGKTGTANRYDAELGRYEGYTASFVGFAPADQPRLVVLSVLQNPKKGHFGGELAAPVFKDVMTFAIKSKKIPPTGSAAPTVRTRAGQ
ncbi:serine hydrolase [Nonomuraea gerenzanensis]|uniref:penicillin-binding transpeptidase domain-containing protein n=1 Tax=Nonomuraea gerenzanensis TaxID=93944 RepID=UPI001CD963A8|nr:penicillin-binding transpeptidase domain-containing protein [Nonomuraea gerenzanensis]UBU16905.1 serine hydrolase [Nonomuraea gerenzanensis]